MDIAIDNRTRPSMAKVREEVDLTKPFLNFVWEGMEEVTNTLKGFMQNLENEGVPQYGLLKRRKKKKKKRKKEKEKEKEIEQEESTNQNQKEAKPKKDDNKTIGKNKNREDTSDNSSTQLVNKTLTNKGERKKKKRKKEKDIEQEESTNQNQKEAKPKEDDNKTIGKNKIWEDTSDNSSTQLVNKTLSNEGTSAPNGQGNNTHNSEKKHTGNKGDKKDTKISKEPHMKENFTRQIRKKPNKNQVNPNPLETLKSLAQEQENKFSNKGSKKKKKKKDYYKKSSSQKQVWPKRKNKTVNTNIDKVVKRI
ncbi:uncharacterized protein [Nicotiana sylvestris]|uniref:uncharacterized protein n=1 Tax=Nicotiana sylvestris TaxID=4096 RepID=UPI00388C775C